MLQRIRESLTLLLIGLLPFHAFFVTVGTRVIEGSGHAPMGLLAAWKEAVLGLIIMIAIVEFLKNTKTRNQKRDSIDLCIAALFLISLCIAGYQLISGIWSLKSFMYGFKYDFIPLIAFVILRRVPWSETFKQWLLRMMIGTGALVVLWGIVTLFLSDAFFTWIGYSDAHSLYLPNGPLAAFQKIGGPEGIRRMQSTFSGPNQLGIWLLIPLASTLALFFERVATGQDPVLPLGFVETSGRGVIGIILLLLMGIVLSFSRAAWIATAIMGLMVLLFLVPRALRKTLGAVAGSFAVILVISVTLVFPQLIFRAISNKGHIERPVEAIQKIIAHPLGMGLGSAGPASNRTSDPCVYLPEESMLDWIQPNTSPLCVFLGAVQTVPDLQERVCHCPFVPENWYLQIGVELGVTGMLLWLIMVVFVIRFSFIRISQSSVHQIAALSFLGISAAGIFLHAWEDSAVAYTAWIVMAMSLHIGCPNQKPLGTL